MKKHDQVLLEIYQKMQKKNVVCTPHQLQEIQKHVFPPRRAEFFIPSSNWKSAFLLVYVANNVGKREANNTRKHILEHCTFPPSCWASSLQILSRWVSQETGKNDIEICESLNLHALSQAVYHLSMQKRVKSTWYNALSLYNYAFSKLDSNKDIILKSTRHHLLITLLSNGRWIEALTTYRHQLHMREMATPAATGFLLTSLGRVACWTEVLRIFSISVAFLRKYILHFPTAEVHRVKRDWGTVVSMAMNIVSRHRPSDVSRMVYHVVEQSKSLQAPLTFLDGNFIQSIERLRREESTELLLQAQRNSLVDPYKIIRGLVSQKRWLDAIQTFTSCLYTLNGERRSECFPKGDIGRSRLAILHSTTAGNVQRVVDRLNSTKNHGRHFSLNDSEIECVFSKSLEDQQSAFWEYCLKLFTANYESKSEYRQPRIPLPSITSLLFRNKKLPWDIALNIFKKIYLTSNHSNCTVTEKASLSVVVDSLAQLLYSQNHHHDAEKIICQLSGKISLPSVFLLNASEDSILAAIMSPSRIDSRVLYHLLMNCRREQCMKVLFCVNAYMVATVGVGFLDCALNPQAPKRDQPSDFKWLSIVPASIHISFLHCTRRSPYEIDVQYKMIMSYLEQILCRQARECPKKEDCESIYCTLYEAVILFLEDVSSTADSALIDFFLRALDVIFKRHGALPPFYMVLPNQVDRLLPRLQYAKVADVDNLKLRLFFMKYYIRLTSESVAKASDQATTKVLLNSFLKMCCRVAEYEKKFKLSDIGNLDFDQTNSASLSFCALRIADKEADLFGSSISPSSLALLYKTLALTSFSSQEVMAALRITKKISSDSRNKMHFYKTHEGTGVLSPYHYDVFQQSFGWEIGLDFWYRTFPQDVLKRVAQNAEAIDHCLNVDL